MVFFRAALLFCVVASARALQFPPGLVDDAAPDEPFKDLKLPGTEAVYNNVKHQAVELQNAIEMQENVSMKEMRSRNAMFAKTLAAQQQLIEADELFNNITQDRIRSVREAIEKLRKNADQLMMENSALTHELEVLQKNISTAFEFANASVQYAAEHTQADPNLKVLEELRREDEKHARSQELQDFARLASVSMLTTDDLTESSATTPEEFVNTLRRNLEEAVAERNASLSKLDATYKKLYSEGEERHASVLRLQAELNQSFADDTLTKERLEQAVSHLWQSKEILSEKIEAIRFFGKERLGEESLQPAKSAAQPGYERTRVQENLNAGREAREIANETSMVDGNSQPYSVASPRHDMQDSADGAPRPVAQNATQEAIVDVDSAQTASHDAIVDVDSAQSATQEATVDVHSVTDEESHSSSGLYEAEETKLDVENITDDASKTILKNATFEDKRDMEYATDHVLNSGLQNASAQLQELETTIVPDLEDIAQDTTSEVDAEYELFDLGADGCPDGREIRSKEECERAIVALGRFHLPTRTIPMLSMPRWCAIKAGECDQSDCAHFNMFENGKGRSAWAPVCHKV